MTHEFQGLVFGTGSDMGKTTLVSRVQATSLIEIIPPKFLFLFEYPKETLGS